MRLFDLHCDTLHRALRNKRMLAANDLCIDFARGKAYSPWIQTMAVWIPDECRGSAAVELFEHTKDLLLRELAGRTDILLCRNGGDICRVTEAGSCGVLLSVEGGAAAAGNLEQLRRLYSCGVRMMTLTWNGDNEIGGGVGGTPGKGLTVFGRQAVAEMERLGMILDLSHASQTLFYDVCCEVNGPIVASHSNAAAVCGHPRNLTDEQFAIICERGGLVGLNFCVDFINGKADASFEELFAHIEHFWALGGQDILALGSDFDGADLPSSLSGIERLGKFYEFILSKNIHETLVDKLFFGNAYNFFLKL